MFRTGSLLLLSLGIISANAVVAAAQVPPAKSDASRDRPTAGIQWFGTLDAGMREAERLGRPILLLSAMPSCAGVPGTW
jgi:hypothetical protein